MKSKFYVHEVWINGWGNMDYPPYLVIRKRIWGIFYKTIIDFGLVIELEETIAKYKIADRMCNLMNKLCK